MLQFTSNGVWCAFVFGERSKRRGKQSVFVGEYF